MAENTETKSSTNVTSKGATEGEGVTRKTSGDTPAVNTVAGGLQVAAPLDAKPGEPQAGNLGAPDTQGVKVQEQQTAGYPLKVTVDNHTHAGQLVKKGVTIGMDIAEYRWALENKIGVPGDKENIGFDVDVDGTVIKPENAISLEELEAQAIKANETPADTETAA